MRSVRKYGVIIFLFLAMVNVLGIISKGMGTRLLSETPKNNFVVVIDAGHGGNDPGKVGTGCLEKDINLAIGLKLKENLEENNVMVIMTRIEDVNLATLGATNKKNSDMINRVDLINSSSADCLISIHQNSYSDSTVKGAQVFYYEASEEGKKMGEILQDKLVSCVDSDNHRKAKGGDNYYILGKSICPGVIVECGFLSCPEEEARLMDEDYQEKIAKALADGIMLYLNK